jgi:predicted phosphodiesterase
MLELSHYINSTRDPEGVLIIAGDLGNISNSDHVNYLINFIIPRYKNVLYVAGNHDYYHSNKATITGILRDIERRCPSFKFLDNEIVELDGNRYIGGTMWYADSKYARTYNHVCMPDVHYIEDLEKWVYRSHEDFINLLESECKRGDIVITHHTCSPKSIPERFRNSQSNYFFCSDQEKIILRKIPSLWVHGHTHNKFIYKLNGTLILCNPFGYPDEKDAEAPIKIVKNMNQVRLV